MESNVSQVFILAACLATLLCLALVLYTVWTIDRAAAARQQAVLEAIQRGAAERADTAVTLEHLRDETREAAAESKHWALKVDEMLYGEPTPAYGTRAVDPETSDVFVIGPVQ